MNAHQIWDVGNIPVYCNCQDSDVFSDVFKTEKVLIFVLYSSKLLKKNSRDFWNVSPFSKIQLVVYYQFCILIGWATTRLYVIAHW